MRQQSTDLRSTLVAWQLFLEPALDASQVAGATINPTDIAKGSQYAQAQIDQAKSLSSTLRRRGLADKAHALDTASAALTGSFTKLTPIAAGARVSPAEYTKVLGIERSAFVTLWDVTSSIDSAIAQDLMAPNVRKVTDRFDLVRTMVIGIGGINLLLALGAGVVLALRTTRRERARRLDERRRLYGAELQQALELSESEDAAYDVVGRALHDAVPLLDVELLIADSSRAHFHRVVDSRDGTDQREGCGVVSPLACPATVRAHTMLFPSSEALSACPYLKNRTSGPCSAVCIPVSIAGRTIGVMHATGADGTLPAAADVENLELSARRAAERVALLRTFERSETQARTDPLTGLLNRRSLENQVRDLHNDGIPYALAYGDLDFFKALNDTHGHEAGDQALRLFSRVMRDSVRPADLVCRYGGEEFVIVLPDCGTDTAITILERVRERLALALTSGRVPPFTVSFGVADSQSADTFSEIVNHADQALLDAKAAGRNRVVLADPSCPRPERAPAQPLTTAATETI